MKIAICGAGLVGSYLYRLLSRSGFNQITVFDAHKPRQTSCGINPCAWVTSVGFEELIEEVGLDPQQYMLRTFDKITMNEQNIRGVIKIIDKPGLIADLLIGAELADTTINTDDFDRIIDATGVARAYLPEIDNDIIASCIQYRVYSDEPVESNINISNLGYAWCFPLSNNEYHIGAGSIMMPPDKMLHKLGWLKNHECLCSCSGSIRFNSPHYSLPFVGTATDNNHHLVWGVGEAIGCVAPLAGEGIIPGLKSACLLLANWEDADAYRRSILKEFSWMKEERSVIDKAMQGRRIGIFDARILKKSAKRLGVNFQLYQALRILKYLVRVG
jgi:flavin-dependent dehydrogenase